MLEIRDLELVGAILTHGNFARASRALNLGQPLLSRRLADLEHRLGGPLFLRHHSRAEPTDLCRALWSGGDEILSRVRGLEATLAEARGQQLTDLRVAAGGIAAETSVLAAAALMLDRHPGVRLTVSTMNWLDVVSAVREREAELGVLDLTALDPESSDFIVEPLQRHRSFFVARPGHPLASLDRVTLAEILSFPFVFLGKVPAWLVVVFAKAREAGSAAGRVHPSFPALIHESPTAALQVVEASDAVAVGTMPIARHALRAGAIVALRWSEPWARTNFGILQVRSRGLSDSAANFIKVLREADEHAFAADEPLLDGVLGKPSSLVIEEAG